MEDDWNNFYDPDEIFADSIKSMFTSMMCIDHPEEIKFYGNFNTDLGVQYTLDFIECSDKSCLSPMKKKSFLTDNSEGNPYVIMLTNQQ